MAKSLKMKLVHRVFRPTDVTMYVVERHVREEDLKLATITWDGSQEVPGFIDDTNVAVILDLTLAGLSPASNSRFPEIPSGTIYCVSTVYLAHHKFA